MQQENKVTIEEMNRVIAEFMGGEYRTPKKYRAYFRFYSKDDFIEREATIDRLNYESDWRYLMPVVEKIEATHTEEYFGFTVEMRRKHCVILCHEPGKQDGCLYQTPYQFKPDSKIHAVLLAVYEFIIWHNKTQNQ